MRRILVLAVHRSRRPPSLASVGFGRHCSSLPTGRAADPLRAVPARLRPAGFDTAFGDARPQHRAGAGLHVRLDPG